MNRPIIIIYYYYYYYGPFSWLFYVRLRKYIHVFGVNLYFYLFIYVFEATSKRTIAKNTFLFLNANVYCCLLTFNPLETNWLRSDGFDKFFLIFKKLFSKTTILFNYCNTINVVCHIPLYRLYQTSNFQLNKLTEPNRRLTATSKGILQEKIYIYITQRSWK